MQASTPGGALPLVQALDTSPGTGAYQGNKDEKHHEDTSKRGFTRYVAVPNCGHRHQSEVYTLPVSQALRITEVMERVTRILHLVAKHATKRS